MNSLVFLKNYKIFGKMVFKGLVRFSQGKRGGKSILGRENSVWEDFGERRNQVYLNLTGRRCDWSELRKVRENWGQSEQLGALVMQCFVGGLKIVFCFQFIEKLLRVLQRSDIFKLLLVDIIWRIDYERIIVRFFICLGKMRLGLWFWG